MNTQFTVTYQIDSLTEGLFVVDDEYLARYHYKDGAIVTEVHTAETLLPPRSKAWYRIMTDWHDKDHENFDYEPEEE